VKDEVVASVPNTPPAGLSKDELLHQHVAGLKTDADGLITIGKLSRDMPTVSQLLNNDQRFAGFHWGIIFSEINHDKPFRSLPPGTQGHITPITLELLFNKTAPGAPVNQAPAAAGGNLAMLMCF